MADKALGKLLAKSKSIRRNRKGSVDGSNSLAGSVGSDVTSNSISRDPSSLSRPSTSHYSQSQSQSHFLSQSELRSEAHEGPWTESDDASLTRGRGRVLADMERGRRADEESTSLVSEDSEDPDLL